MKSLITAIILLKVSLCFSQGSIELNGTAPVRIGSFGGIKIAGKPSIINNTQSEVRESSGSFQLHVSATNMPTSFLWSTVSGTGIFESPTEKDAWVTGCSFGLNVFKVTATNSYGTGETNISVLVRPEYDSVEIFGANPFYSEDKFFGTINISPYASDSSLITYTGVDNPFTSEYLNKEFVAFRAHKTESFPTTRNYTPGVSTCVYAKVIRVIDGKNVRVDFAYNGNNESSPQITNSAFGQFFFNNRKAFDSAFANRQRAIGLSNGKTYVTKGLFGGLYYASQPEVSFIACDTNSSIPANIKFSMEDAFYAATNNLYTGWEQASAHWVNDYGSRFEGIRLVQVSGDNNFKVGFINIRWLPPVYSNTYNDGSVFNKQMFSSGTAGNYTASYQHYGIVDVSGSDMMYEKRKWSSYSFPDTSQFVLPFGFAYTNSGGKLDSVETITGRRLDISNFMEYRLRPNPSMTVNSSWVTNSTMANMKGKVATANSTYHPPVAGGGYGAAGNYWTIRGLGRDTSVSFQTDTLLSDIGTDVRDRKYMSRLKATFTEQSIDGIQRLVLNGSSDSMWTVWTNQSYYNWSLWTKAYSVNFVKFTYSGEEVIIPITSVGIENYRDDFVGVPDSRNNVTVGLRSVAMGHDVPSIGTVVILTTHPLRGNPEHKLTTRRYIPLPGDTLKRVGTSDMYLVTKSYFYTPSNEFHIDSFQNVTLLPVSGAPSLDLSVATTYNFEFMTQKMRNSLGAPFSDAVSFDMRFNGSELNYGDSEINHDWAFVRKYGRLRYGTEFGDNINHNQQLWKMPKVQIMKDVYEFSECDNYGVVAGRSFARREIITGKRTVYIIDRSILRGQTGGAISRVRWQNRPSLGGNGFINGGVNNPPNYAHGVEQDGLGANISEDVRFIVRRGDTADFRNVSSDFGIGIMPFDSTSVFLLDNISMTHSSSSNFGYEKHIRIEPKFANSSFFSDTALLGGTGLGPIYPLANTLVGRYIGSNINANFSSSYTDYNNTIINITGTLANGDFKYINTPISDYSRYCYAIKVNGLNPLPGSKPVTYISPCPPL